jgi:broad-specificity NMP kinase
MVLNGRWKLLVINGASGTGKTSLAHAIAGRCPNVVWIHPDELMDTPSMRPEDILDRSLALVKAQARSATAIVDCQIRPTAMVPLLAKHAIGDWCAVLLTCPRSVREQRLLDRGWGDEAFDRIDRWADVLFEESTDAGHSVFDTSMESIDSILEGVGSKFCDGD